MNKIWITCLEPDSSEAQRLLEIVHACGLKAGGHFWTDDLERQAWAGPIDQLIDPACAAWLIRATPESFNRPEVRKGLSLLALRVQADRGVDFPVILLHPGYPPLPTPLAVARVLHPETALLESVLLNGVRRGPVSRSIPYRMCPHPMMDLGLWLEVGPGPGEVWEGALLGLSSGEIQAHGVGPAGQLPERCRLDYQEKGLVLSVDEVTHTAWGVRNRIGEGESYYVKVAKPGHSVVFGAQPGGGEGEGEGKGEGEVFHLVLA